MDLRWLDDVLTLLEEGNLTRAAERRNVTQPAFSRRIRAFEDWLGTPIIERQTNRILASPALTANEDEIRALAARLRELRTKVASYDPTKTTISLAAQHAPIHSVFPDLAVRARDVHPGLSFRLRAGNLGDCVSMFLRGDASLLLCYEAQTTEPFEFGTNVHRASWGTDFLIPVVGGALRYAVRPNGEVPINTPGILYPGDSYFGEILRQSGCAFGHEETTATTACTTAFSSGIAELVSKGLGVGWIPYNMAYRALESGELLSLSKALGKVPLDVAIYADGRSDVAMALLELWTN